MPINQIGDDGAVIDYKPNLEYKKSLNVPASAENAAPDGSNTNYSGEIQYSSTLSALEEALPSGTLEAIDASIGLMEKLILALKKGYKQANWGEFSDISSLISAIKSGNKEFAEKFVEFHSQNINASIIPELMMYIAESQERLKALSSTVKELYYGRSNITLEEAREIDSGLINQLKHLEAVHQLAKINYYALVMDATLNRSVSVYTYSVNREAMKIAEVGTKADSSEITPHQMKLIQKLYDEVRAEILDRKSWYDSQQSIEIMQKTLYNYYVKRAETIELYGLLDGRHEDFMLGRKLIERQRTVEDALFNVSRALNGHVYYTSEIAKMEREKGFLMNIYSRLNYNTDNS